MQKLDWKSLASKLEKEIEILKEEIRKREEIVNNLSSLQDISGVTVPIRRARRKRSLEIARKPVLGKKRVVGRRGYARLKPDKVEGTLGVKRSVQKSFKKRKTADILANLLASMPQPVPVDVLAEKFHSLYPKQGGLKYRSVVASITSRDARFEKLKGNKVILKSE